MAGAEADAAGVPPGWVGRAEAEFRHAGHLSTAPRAAIIEAIGAQRCVLTADQLSQELRDAGRAVGTATIYRTLDLLEELGLLQRLDIGDGLARYEPAVPGGGNHHHHYVCSGCGTVTPFEDESLEQAIADFSERFTEPVEEHDVILKGVCEECRRNA